MHHIPFDITQQKYYMYNRRPNDDLIILIISTYLPIFSLSDAYYIYWIHHHSCLALAFSESICPLKHTQELIDGFNDKFDKQHEELASFIINLTSNINNWLISSPHRGHQDTQRRTWQVFIKIIWPREETNFLYHILWWTLSKHQYQQ